MQIRSGAIALAFTLAAALAAAADDNLSVPADKLGGEPATMMSRYWMGQAEEAFRQWRAAYEARKTPEEIAAHTAELRDKFVAAVGGLPERTPLKPQVTGTIEREGYRVEKVIFESQPKHFVTALLFLPDAAKFPPRWPGVLVPCGHSHNGKASNAYQTMGALLALHGMVALVFDPIDQGERGQHLGEGGWPDLAGTSGHWRVGIGSTLVGRNTARYEIWDGMRAIDYLQSRPEVDPARIGCTGNSGGGTQTSYLMALDDRIQAAAVSCYLCGFPALLRTIGPQDAEQCIFGQLAFDMDHADYATMQAPLPILMCVATKDFFDIGGAWATYRDAKRVYTRLGHAENVAILENDEGHNYNQTQREGVLRWMSRWLLDRDEPLSEPAVKLLTEEECHAAPEGLVMRLPGARSVYDLNTEYEAELAKTRQAAWANGDHGKLLAEVRRLAGIRPLADVPRPEVEKLAAIEHEGYSIAPLVLRIEAGRTLPGLLFTPRAAQQAAPVLYLHEEGKQAAAAPGGPVEALVRDGRAVLALDLAGIGQLAPAEPAWKDAYTAYLLGRSYVGLRAEEILAAARYLGETAPAGSGGVQVVAVGRVGIPALHAAALESDLFTSVRLERTLAAWSSAVADPRTTLEAADLVHGALRAYDLTDLAALLGAKLTAVNPPRPPSEQVYRARRVPAGQIQLDGRTDEPAWAEVAVEDRFTFPWKKVEAPRTEFRACHDGAQLYFAFTVADADIGVTENLADEQDAVFEDRAEMYFSRDYTMRDYFCAEIDSRGRVYDYRGAFYRHLDPAWDWEGIEAAAAPVPGGYAVEGRISLASFRQLGFRNVAPGAKLRFGMYRAEFSHDRSGLAVTVAPTIHNRGRKLDGPPPLEEWMSWVDPGGQEPDFHVPASLGWLELE